MQITGREYDILIESFEKMDVPTYWPSPLQSEYLENNAEEFIFQILYLYVKGRAPENNAEKYSKRTLGEIISTHLEIIENDDEPPISIDDFKG